jgi:hypothetical protein
LFLAPGDRVEVRGEASFQTELSRIVGGKTALGHSHPVVAVLFPDDDNKYDPNAIEVVVNEKLVGYIPKELCVKFRELAATAQQRGSFLASQAVIVGGWNRGDGDEGYFGIYLDAALGDQYALPGAATMSNGLEILNVASVRTLIAINVNQRFEVVGESSHGWDIGELLGHPHQSFVNEALLVTLTPAENGGFDVIGLGNRQKIYGLERTSGRKIGSVAKKDRTYWQSIYNQALSADGYPLLEVIVNGYGKLETSGKREPIEVQFLPR